MGEVVEAPHPVGGPVRAAWRERALTRAVELESLCYWVRQNYSSEEIKNSEVLAKAITCYLNAARDAAAPKKRFGIWVPGKGASLERAMGNLDAAEANLLNFAPTEYVLGQMPSLVNHVQRHLLPNDPRRQRLEHIAEKVGVKDSGCPLLEGAQGREVLDKKRTIEAERGKIVTAVRGASSEALREQLRVRSFRNVVLVTTFFMALLATGIAYIGYSSPTTLPLCFEPEKSGKTVVVCPTAQSQLLQTGQQSGPAAPDVDDTVKKTVGKGDIFVVEVVGLIAATVAAAGAIRRVRGSSEPYSLPVTLAALKLPTGAITAVLGLLLMRGQFVPGLTALDTSAQILAWALVFGYAQQMFTRLVDQQAHTVLDSVRGASRRSEPSPTTLTDGKRA